MRKDFQAQEKIPPTDYLNPKAEADIPDFEATSRTILEPINIKGCD